MTAPIRIAILDDYQHIALQMADWSRVSARATITVFHDHVSERAALIERLAPFDVLCVMRERTPLPREVIEALPNVKLIASTGLVNASIDMNAARERGITVTSTNYTSTPTIEFTWALILALARHVPREHANVRAGGWQQTLGVDLAGKTLGLLGLGRIGSRVAEIARAFGMNVVAWSQHLTAERAAECGARLVSKDALFRDSDIVSVHLVLSGRTRGLIDAEAFGLMKPSALFVNTSRGPIADEAALVEALASKHIAGAALDVFDIEPLPAEHPLRTLDNVLATPHIGYVTENLYKTFYGDVVEAIVSWLNGKASEQ